MIADARQMPQRGATQLPSPEEVEQARRELREVVAGYDRELRPAGAEFVIAMLGVLAANYPAVRRSPEEAKIAAATFVSTFASWPADILASAMRRAIRSSRFFPSIAEFIDDDDIDGPGMWLHERQQDRNEFARWIDGSPPRSLPFGGYKL